MSTQFLGLDVMLYFLGIGLMAILRDRGVGLEQLAVLSVTPIVLMIYFLWAPLIDRFGVSRLGHYMSWLAPCQMALTGCCIAMAALDPVTDFGWIVAVLTIALIITSLHEPAANALVIRLMDPELRNRANGMVTGCRYIGTLAGGGGVLYVYPQWGWTAAMVIVMTPNVVALLAAVPLARLERARPTEPVGTRADAGAAKVGIASLFTLFRNRTVAKWTLLGIPFYVLGYYVASALVTPMLVDAHYSLEDVGTLQVGLASAVGIGAALGAGFIGTRLGTKRTLFVFGLLRVVAILALLPLATGQAGGLVVFAVVVMTVADTTGGTVLNTVIMDSTRRASPGVDFSVQQAAISLIRILSTPMGLLLAAIWGYVWILIGAGAVALLGTLAATRYQPPVPSRIPPPSDADRRE